MTSLTSSMGKKLDRLLGRGRTLKASKLKPLLSLALTRLTVLKAQRGARHSNSLSDIVQLLQQGHHERALLRVEQVIKEQNMLDAYLMMESYCNLLIERINLLELEKECPEELKEAISTLIYASSRSGEFPELLEIRSVFQSHFGREFVARSIELRNNCAVNTKMIQKMSTLHPSLEIRTKVLKEIAAKNDIVLQLDDPSMLNEGDMGLNLKPASPNGEEPGSSRAQRLRDDAETSLHRGESSELSDSFKTRQKYKDVAHAAQAAFESAAYAAEAARAAVELSRSNGAGGPSGPSSPNPRKVDLESVKTDSELENDELESKALASSFSSSSSGSKKVLRIDINYEMDLQSEAVDEAISHSYSGKQIPSRFQAGFNMEPDKSPVRLNLENGPISVRARRLRGY